MARKENKINPYLLELLKSLIKYSRNKKWDLNINCAERTKIAEGENINLSLTTLNRTFNEITPKDKFDNNTLDELVKLIREEFEFLDWNDFFIKESNTETYSTVKNNKEKIEKDVENRLNDLVQSKIKGNLKHYFTKVSETASEYLIKSIREQNKLLKYEDSIIQLKHVSTERRELEKQITIIKRARDENLEKLENVINLKPENILTPDFLKLYSRFNQYKWDDDNSIKMAEILDPVSDAILDYIEKDDGIITLNLKISSLKTKWAMGQKAFAQQRFYQAYNQIESIISLGLTPYKDIQNSHQQLLDYGCGFDLGLLSSYRDLGNNYDGDPSEVINMKIVPLQCSACRHVRENKLEEAKKWLDNTGEQIEKFSFDRKLSRKDSHHRLSYFYLIEGAYRFKKKKYKSAEKSLRNSLNSFEIAKRFNDVEKSFVYYMLYEIGKIDNTNIKYGYWALQIMENSIRKNYCLFDFEQILKKLKKELKFKKP